MNDTMTIPLEIMDGRFSLEEISTITILLASAQIPNINIWTSNNRFNEIIDQLTEKNVLKFENDKLEINLQKDMSIAQKIREILQNNGIDIEASKEILELVETVGSESFEMGYHKGYDDGRIDFAEPSFSSYGKKEDY